MNKNFENFDNFDDFDDKPQNLAENPDATKVIFDDISSNSGDTVDISSYSENSGENIPKGTKKRNKKRIIVNVVTSVVLVICILMTTLMGWFINNADTSLKDVPILKWLFGSGNYEDIGYDDANKTESGNFEDLKLSVSNDVTYFLIVGCDWTSTKQTDVIVVVCMDHKNETCSMLQIPRDTYVEGYAVDGKINSVYMNAKEGELKINALRRCLNNQFGMPIDNYVLFSIKGAVNVVDAIGGVEMNLKKAIEIENPLHFGKYYKIGPGKVTLSGKDAIGFMRKRYGSQDEDENYDGSDIGRVKQQRKFYAALFKKLQKTSTTQIWRIANSCFNQVQTNMTLNETVAYTFAAKALKMKKIHIFGLPGQAATYQGLSYYSIHRDDYLECFNKYFNPHGEQLTMDDFKCPEIYSLAGYDKNNNWLTGDDSTLNEYK